MVHGRSSLVKFTCLVNSVSVCEEKREERKRREKMKEKMREKIIDERRDKMKKKRQERREKMKEKSERENEEIEVKEKLLFFEKCFKTLKPAR